MKLYHVFKTDVVKIIFDKTGIELFGMASVMYALLETISTTLNIERSDINGCLRLITGDDGTARFATILFDSVPGGAGHVRRLVTDDGAVLKTILRNAHSLVANCTCDPSCYNCIRNYANSKIHDNLDRHIAADLLQYYITGNVSIEDIREEIPAREEVTVDVSSEIGAAHTFEDYDDLVDDKCIELARAISDEIGSDPSHVDTTLIVNQDRHIVAEAVWNPERIILFNDGQSDDCAYMEHNAREWIVVSEDDLPQDIINLIRERRDE
jgi:uncharacterized protein YeeX (DUF496 family)